MKDFYWDIRPKPEFGTIELRMCDVPLTVERAAAMAGYLWTLCLSLLERTGELSGEQDHLVYNHNRFQACRFGLDGTLMESKAYASRSLREDIQATLQRLAPHTDTLGLRAALEHVRALITTVGNDASYLRGQCLERGSAQGMVEAAIENFRR